MNINTPHFNAIANEILSEAKSYSSKQTKKGKKVTKTVPKKHRKSK